MTAKHFLLFYDYAPDYMERRGEFRAAHFEVATRYIDSGELVLAGALADPPDGAVFVWKAQSDAPIRAFVDADPYRKNGLVTGWRIREWTTVAGAEALNKVALPS